MQTEGNEKFLTRWATIHPVLDEFQRCLATHVPKFTLVHAVDRHWPDAEYKKLRPRGFPSKLRGVCLIFDDAPRLQYVGLAMVNFDKRVWSHDGVLSRRWTDIITFPDEFSSERIPPQRAAGYE